MARGRPNTAEPLLLAYVRQKGDPVVDLQLDAGPLAAFAGKKAQTAPALEDLMRRMQRKGLAHPLQRGRWLVSDRPSRLPRLDALEPLAEALLRRLDKDYYLSWHSALWQHGLIDQQSRKIFVAVKERKRNARVGMWEVQFVTVAEEKFFGAKRVSDLDWPVCLATPEKALIDSFDRPDLAAPPAVVANALRRAWRSRQIDPDALVQSALRFGRPMLNRRLGFFMELYEIPGWQALTQHTGRKSAVPLAPGVPPYDDPVPVNRRWRVYEDPVIVGAALDPK